MIGSRISSFFILTAVALQAIPVPRVSAAAVGDAGRVSASFLEINPSVREEALGGDQVAAQGLVSSLFANPAGIGTLTVPQLWFTHDQSFVDTRYETLAFGFPIPQGGLAFSGQYVDEGPVDRVGIDGNDNPVPGLGTFRPFTAAGQMTFSRRIVGRIYGGAGVKTWRERLDQTSSTGWALDGGLLTGINSRLDLALAVRNLGPLVQGFSLPTSVAAGAAYRLIEKSKSGLSLFGEIDRASFRPALARFGAEFSIRPFFVRTGLSAPFSASTSDASRFSVGAGARFRNLAIDYAWRDSSQLGDQQRIGVSIAFGLTPEERAAASRELDSRMDSRVKSRSDEHVTAAEIAAQKNDLASAEAELLTALTWEPNNRVAQQRLEIIRGRLREREVAAFLKESDDYREQDRWIDSAFCLQEAAKLAPQDSMIQRRLEEARDQIAKKARSDGRPRQKLQKMFDRGVGFYVAGNFDQALTSWQEVLAADPSWPSVQEYVAKTKTKILEKKLAARTPPTDRLAETFSRRAYTLYSLGQIDDAIAAWKKAIALDPQNADANWALQEARAKKSLGGGLGDGGESPRVVELNAEALRAYADGRLEAAVAFWNQALEMEPHNLKIQTNLSRVQNELAAKGRTP